MDSVEVANRLGYPIERFFAGWFLGADLRSIPYNKLVEWVCSIFYGKAPASLEASDCKAATELVDKMCVRFDLKPPPGDDPDIRFIDLFAEPLLIFQRSLMSHVVASGFPRVAVATLFRSVLGLRRACCEETGMYYWWRAPLSKDAGVLDSTDKPPDLFLFHGLCGFTGYVPLVLAVLLKSPSRGAVLFEIEDVSQCLEFSRPLTREAVVKTARHAADMLRSARGGMQRSCIVLGHSLGSCAAVQLLEEPPTEIAGIVLIDPVCIMLMLPDVAHGFLHRAPEALFDWFCFLWCATEPGIAQFFRRRFFWYNSWLNPKHIKEIPTLVCLSEKDRLVPSCIVRAYVEKMMPKAEVLWWEKLEHTGFMASLRCHTQILQWIHKCSFRKSPSTVSLAGSASPYMGG
jgi:hypothetical protein